MSAWVRETAPVGYRLERFRWQLRDERGAAGGRGTVRFAAPDSVRLDVAGPFGAGRAAAVVVGDSAVWTDPPDAIARLVPSYPLMWALFGTARMPGPRDSLRGEQTATSVAWQYVSGTDTVEYVRTSGAQPHLLTEVRQGPKVLGRVDATLGPDGRPVTARLTVPSVPARLDLTFTTSATPPAFTPDTWLPGQR
ncbi:MAG: hypothetical protein H0U85_01480 [Gemmatimonadales bacterium]|nr:hypothetical protein [Gemmatimonadales bacterium]